MRGVNDQDSDEGTVPYDGAVECEACDHIVSTPHRSTIFSKTPIAGPMWLAYLPKTMWPPGMGLELSSLLQTDGLGKLLCSHL